MVKPAARLPHCGSGRPAAGIPGDMKALHRQSRSCARRPPSRKRLCRRRAQLRRSDWFASTKEPQDTDRAMVESKMLRRRFLMQLAAGAALAPMAARVAGAADRVPAASAARSFQPTLFPSYFLGGFECSTHRRADDRRVDVIAATGHDRLALQDYRQLREHRIDAARDGVRWHLVEAVPGRHDWSSVLSMLRAAETAKMQVTWDLLHFGWPDHLDPFSGTFVEHFARYAEAFARLHLAETGRPPMICPINEIGFLSFAAGELGWMNRGQPGRGMELKRNLVRAMVAAAAAARAAAPGATVMAIEPLVNIAAGPGDDPDHIATLNEAQTQALDMLDGQLAPELGGGPKVFDVVGVNYYWYNQWVHEGEHINAGDPRYRPLHRLVQDVHGRYDRPIFMSETGIEGDQRAEWLRYIGRAMREVVLAGVPLEGICIYPIMSHPGWDDDRYCPNGILEMAPHDGVRRPVYEPLAAELDHQQDLFEALFGTA
jgi:hypothetical protein